jgi:CRP/FNR family transcriptional regulator, cyclic AMP receptor protein
MASFTSHHSHAGCLSCERRHLLPFCNLTEGALIAYDKIGIIRAHARGVRLFMEGEMAGSVFVICSGKVKLSTSSRDGKTMILRIAGPGDVMGLGAVLANVAYETTAEVIEPCQVKTIGKQDFLTLLSNHRAASMHVAKALSSEYLTAFYDARRLALSGSSAGRLARLLLDWARSGAISQSENRFTMAFTHGEIASMAGLSRETVTRSLNRFRRNQWIRIHGIIVTVLMPEQLERLAGCDSPPCRNRQQLKVLGA